MAAKRGGGGQCGGGEDQSNFCILKSNQQKGKKFIKLLQKCKERKEKQTLKQFGFVFSLLSSSPISALRVSGCIFPLGSFHQVPAFLLLRCCPLTRRPSYTQREKHRHTPSWYQSERSQWKSIIVLCHGNVPSCWNGVGWVCVSRANIITVRFPHVEIWSVQRLSWKLSLWSVLA